MAAFGPDIAGVVLEVTDDKALPKAERKRLPVEHAAQVSLRAQLVKMADKTCNLRDIVACPPADWSDDRKRVYFEWARSVVDRVRDVNPVLGWCLTRRTAGGLEAVGGITNRGAG